MNLLEQVVNAVRGSGPSGPRPGPGPVPAPGSSGGVGGSLAPAPAPEAPAANVLPVVIPYRRLLEESGFVPDETLVTQWRKARAEDAKLGQALATVGSDKVRIELARQRAAAEAAVRADKALPEVESRDQLVARFRSTGAALKAARRKLAVEIMPVSIALNEAFLSATRPLLVRIENEENALHARWGVPWSRSGLVQSLNVTLRQVEAVTEQLKIAPFPNPVAYQVPWLS